MQARLENALLAFPTVPGSFKWEVGVTPLSDPRWVVFAPLLYVLSVVGAKELLGERTLRLGPLPALHNLVLALGSAAMFAGTGLEAWRAWRLAGSAEWLFCLPAGSVAVGPLFWWSYVYYLSKFYELLDTFLRVAKGQPLTLLHVFHHAIVIYMAYQWLDGAQSLQVIGLLTNTAVHVVMYSYYFLSSIGLRPGRAFKMCVTNGQIVQFVFSLACSLPFLHLHFSKPAGCSGFGAWCFNVCFNVVLLLLFRRFARETYGKGGKGGKAGKGKRE